MRGEALAWPCDECGEVMVNGPEEICSACEDDYELAVGDAIWDVAESGFTPGER